MSENLHSVALGQEVFVIEKGEVVRTMIGKITEDYYTLLNGSCPEHWSSFDEVRTELDRRLAKKQEELRATLRRLAKKRQSVWGSDYRQTVFSAPYRVADLREDPKDRTRTRKRVLPPQDYLLPGTKVFVPIVPWTRTWWEGADCYRPATHFVLETMIRSVCFTADSCVHYNYSTPFTVKHMFTSRVEAEEKLRDLAKMGEGEDIYFVPHREEKEYLASLRSEPPF